MAELTRYHRERYGDWRVVPVVREHCAHTKRNGHQCSRKRGHGPEGAFCRQHARQHEERRDE